MAEWNISSLALRYVIQSWLPTSQWKLSVTLTDVEGTQTEQVLRVRWGGGGEDGVLGLIDWQMCNARCTERLHRSGEAPAGRCQRTRSVLQVVEAKEVRATASQQKWAAAAETGRHLGAPDSWQPVRNLRLTPFHSLPRRWCRSSERLPKHLLSFPLGSLSHLTSWISDKSVTSCVDLKNAWSSHHCFPLLACLRTTWGRGQCRGRRLAQLPWVWLPGDRPHLHSHASVVGRDIALRGNCIAFRSNGNNKQNVNFATQSREDSQIKWTDTKKENVNVRLSPMFNMPTVKKKITVDH